MKLCCGWRGALLIHSLSSLIGHGMAHGDDLGPFGFDPVKAKTYNDQFVSTEGSVIALVNARVIDGTGAPALEDQTVIISGGNITAVGPKKSVKIPKGAQEISVKGKTVVPGWVMHHEHFYHHSLAPIAGAPFLAQPSMVTFPRLFLASGVTTARTVGTYHPHDDLKLKEGIQRGIFLGPDLDLTAPFIQGKTDIFQLMPEVNSAEEARKHVEYWSDKGFDSFKTYISVSKAQMKAAIDESHRLGKKITAHLCSISYIEAAELGIDELEHGFQAIGKDLWQYSERTSASGANHTGEVPILNEDSLHVQPEFESSPDHTQSSDHLEAEHPADPATESDPRGIECQWDQLFAGLPTLDINGTAVQTVFDVMLQKGVVIDSTLGGLARLMNNKLLPAVSEETKSFYTTERRAQWDVEMATPSFGPDLTWYLEHLMAMDYAFWKRGGKLVVGADAVGLYGALPGITNLESLELLARAGIPPVEVIKIATKNGAEELGLADRGQIAVGKRADLIVMNGNPDDDIKAIYDIETVFKAGIGYNSAKLKESVKSTLGMIF